MGALDGDIARIVMLHADNGLSDAEIATMIGAPRTRIAKILSRAREKLRKVTGARGAKGRGGTGPPKEGVAARSASPIGRSTEETPDAN